MRTAKFADMYRGWFIGNFPKSAYKTKEFEVAAKEEKAGERVERHLHKIATEITLVVKGRIRMNGKEFRTGDIIILEPGESSDYEALEETFTVIVKVPSALKDKYYTDKK